MKVEILDDAKTDLIDAFRFYDIQKEGLGDYFLESLFTEIDRLKSSGGIHSRDYGYHRLVVEHFPFAVYYRVEANRVFVHAVIDCRRDPKWIAERLE